MGSAKGTRVKQQVFEFGAQPWPDGAGVLQFYMPVDVQLPANRQLMDLITQWRTAIDGAPVTIVEDQHLHVTMDVVADRVAEDIPEAERRDLVDALRDRLHGWARYQGTAGSALAYVSGVVVDVSPAGPLRQLAGTIRDVLRTVRGDAAGTYRQPKAHIGIAYAYDSTDSDPWQSALRKIDPNHAPVELAEVHLVDVRADRLARTFTWDTVGEPIHLV